MDYRKISKPLYIGTVILLAAALLCLYFFGGRPSVLGLFRTGSVGTQMELDTSFSYATQKYNGGVAVLGKDGLVGMSNTGRRAWDISFPVTNPLLSANGRYILAAEDGGTKAVLCVGGKVKREFHSEEKIHAVYVNARGASLLLTEERGYKGCIQVYNRNGKEIYKWHSAGQNILSAVLSEDTTRMAVSVVNMQDASRLCSVFEFNLKETAPRTLQVGDENLVANLVYNKNELCAIGDEALYYFKKNRELKFSMDYAGRTLQRYSFYSGGVLSMAFLGGTEGGATAVEFYDTNGVLKGSCPVSGAVSAMDTFGNYALVSTQGGTLVIGKDGKIKDKHETLISGKSVFLCGGRNRVFHLSGTQAGVYIL